MKYIVILTDIEYDTDGKPVEGLPESVKYLVDSNNEDNAVSDALDLLSNDTGWMINASSSEVLET